MIDLYYWRTPNGQKVAILLEELGQPYRLVPVHIGRREQFRPEFLEISPNNKIPALVDHAPLEGGPVSVFESGAILWYLAEKHGRFLPAGTAGRLEVLQWLFWQVGGLGPMAGQNHHFRLYAPAPLPYAIERYTAETARLYGVLERRLADREFIAGAYSIADIAAFPWIEDHALQAQRLQDFPALARWYEAIRARPAVQRAEAVAESVRPRSAGFSAEEKRALFQRKGRSPGAG